MSRSPESFEEVVQAHHVAVFHYALRMTKDEVRAEDALQDTFVAAMKGWPAFRGEASVKTWLFTIARHVVYRQGRLKAGEPVEFEPLESLGLEAGWGSATDPERLAMRAQDRNCLVDAFDALSLQDREILQLRDVEGFTGPEAAELLGVNLRAVKSRLHRARLRLAGALKARMKDD